MPAFSEDQVSDAELTEITNFMAEQVNSQLAPATLPTSGGPNSSPWPLLLLLGGAGVLASGFVLRKVAR
jgi:hypothetical protein